MNKVAGFEMTGRNPFAHAVSSLIQRSQLTLYELRHEQFGVFLFLRPSQAPRIAYCLCMDDDGLFSVVLADGDIVQPGATLVRAEHLTLFVEKDRLNALRMDFAKTVAEGMRERRIEALVVGDVNAGRILKVRCTVSLELFGNLIPGAAARETLMARYKPQG